MIDLKILRENPDLIRGAVKNRGDSVDVEKIVELDEDKKATMVNNLLVALVSEHDVQPIINTGTLYQ